ncbi:MAG: TonB-dependent receptor [Oleiphilaceae bacterium]|nr:TonB-dependent receptor [Oleiphilaceae bacterium]
MLKLRKVLNPGLVFSLGLVATSSTLADEATDTFDTVVVTATRTAQTVNQSTASVQVIDRAEIERLQARSVPDLLRGMPGVQITTNGGRGKSTSLFVRGTNSDHVLVLIDGVKVGSATSGTTPFQDLPIDQIERIEIVRGPRSSLYGSEAIGGVIQIFTRQAKDKPRGGASVTVGSDATREFSAHVSGKERGFYYSAGASAVTTKGYNICAPEAASGGGCWTNEPDDDAYESEAVHLNAGYAASNGSKFGVTTKLSRNESEFDGGFVNEGNSEQSILGVHADFGLLDFWWLKFQAARSKDYSDNALNGVHRTTFNTERDTVTLQNDFLLHERIQITLGGDYQRDEIATEDTFSETQRENFGGFAQALVSAEKFELEVSARHDDNEFTGNSKTGGVGVAYRVSPGLQWRANFGKAFKAPSFNELYFPFFGNPALKPEESKSAEMGIRVADGGTQLDMAIFNTEVDDLIVYDASIFAPNNIDEAEIRGLEVSLKQRISDQWSFGANLTALSPRNVSNDANDGNLLPRRPQRSGKVELDYNADDWSMGGSVFFAGSAFDDIANSNSLDPYQVLDLRAAKDLNSDWQLQARVENVFDSYYETARHYIQPRRSFYLTLRYSPE